LYGNSPYESKGHRLPWMDLGEVRKAVFELLEEDRIDIPWGHIREEGHDVTEEEIRTTLEKGPFELHAVVDGRYEATFSEREFPLAVLVVFELWEADGLRRIKVLTAYHIPKPWGRPLGR